MSVSSVGYPDSHVGVFAQESSKMRASTFQNRSFKPLVVTSMFICSIAMSVFHKAMQFLSYIFAQKASASIHAQLAAYNFNKAPSFIATYNYFGNSVINFSENSTATPLEVRSFDKTIDLLKHMYQEQIEEKFNEISDKDFPISIDELNPLAIDEGVCLGSGMNFIKEYLHALSEGKTVSDAVEEISSLYVHGATQNAQITQILYSALFHSQKFQQMMSDIVEEGLEKIKDIKEKSSDELEKISNKTFSNSDSVSDEDVSRVKKQLDEISKTCDTDMKARLDEAQEKIGSICAKQLSVLAQANNLQVSYEKLITMSKNKSMLQDGVSGFKDLDPGVYSLSVRYASDANCLSVDNHFSQHCIVYIKETEDKGYFFDPNVGTISYETEKDLESHLNTFSSKIYTSAKKQTDFAVFHWNLAD